MDDADKLMSIIAAFSKTYLLALPCKVGKLTIAVDRGATINVMSDNSFRAVRRSMRVGRYRLFPNYLNVLGVSGLNLEILGKVRLKISPGKKVWDFHTIFYITNIFALPVDAILGLNSLKKLHMIINQCGEKHS